MPRGAYAPKAWLPQRTASRQNGYRPRWGAIAVPLLAETSLLPPQAALRSPPFDAGVAMYVGLSLMSVAGSAVVIGKKKEF